MRYAIYIQRNAEQAENLFPDVTFSHEQASTALGRVAVAFGHDEEAVDVGVCGVSVKGDQVRVTGADHVDLFDVSFWIEEAK